MVPWAPAAVAMCSSRSSNLSARETQAIRDASAATAGVRSAEVTHGLADDRRRSGIFAAQGYRQMGHHGILPSHQYQPDDPARADQG